MNIGDHAALDVHVDDALLQRFIALSGDRSSLHTDAAFGARSAFGSTLMHGMLPVALMPLVLQRLFPAQPMRLLRARARFLKPLPPGRNITMRCTVDAIDDGVVKVVLEIASEKDDVITRGSFDLLPIDVAATAPEIGKTPSAITDVLEEQELYFEDLETGRNAGMPLHMGSAQRRAHLDLLSAVSPDATGALAQFDGDRLAALCALSTLVGMQLPGRTATFQEFELAWESGTDGTPTQLHSTLTRRSDTTRTITQEVVLTNGTDPIARGKVSVLVARSPFRPPTMEELAQSSLDHGLKDQVVLITGASRGLGATTAKLFAVHGARVVINYRSSAEQARAIVDEITEHGGQAIAVQGDVTKADEVQALVKTTVDHWGRLDVLVNNAVGNFRPIAFQELRWEQVQEDIDTIVKGAFLTTQAVLPHFLKQGGGRIVNLSTVAVETPPAQQAKYVIAKSALNGLTRSLAVEFADRNIAVNLVVPSFAETDLTSGFNAVALGKLKANSPMKRLAAPQEIAEAVLFLASRRAGFTTGQKLMVTGGLPPFH